jgi:ATP dependent DNA ligase C terminal region
MAEDADHPAQEFVAGGDTVGPTRSTHWSSNTTRPIAFCTLAERETDLQRSCASNCSRGSADWRLGCPFVNLPEAKSGRWGAGLTAAKMKDCRWLRPVLVAQIEFLEWTADNHLRHTKFVALREDKDAQQIRRE